MVRPTKKFSRASASEGSSQAASSERRRHKDKYFESSEPRREPTKYDARATVAPRIAEDAEPEITIDLREDSAFADEPVTEHYYLRSGGASD